MELGPFLKEMRIKQGHGTIGALANFAKALGIVLSRESLRLFENEQKVPNPNTRKLLSELLRLDVYQKYTLEKLCAEAHINTKFNLGPAYILDLETAQQVAAQIASKAKILLEDTLPIDSPATDEDISKAEKELEETCRAILSPFETLQKSI
jgi:hypothetical protein